MFSIFVFIIFTGSISGAAQEWAAPPKSVSFNEFKFFKGAYDKKTKLAIFNKGKKPLFTLSKPFDGGKTVICYGSTKPLPKSMALGLACALKSVGTKSCSQVKADQCMQDNSVMLIPHD